RPHAESGPAMIRAAAVTVDGRALADPSRLRGIRVAARLDQPTQCELALATAPGTGALDPPVRPGAALDVRLDGQPEALFAGEVTAVEVEYAGDGVALLRIRAYDPLHRLRKRQELRVFESVTAAEVADRAAACDRLAERVWREAVEALADGLATGQALYDVATVVLGGGLAQAGPRLFDPLRDALRERLTFHREPRLVAAALGDEAGCLGAALLALDTLAKESR
ncbi:ROK family protein, partial [Micromonospora maritima]|uniref:ROK family protein n=1 Tax=Micromonospora maritima TaxID=986711 RepID=UPI001FE83B75